MNNKILRLLCLMLMAVFVVGCQNPSKMYSSEVFSMSASEHMLHVSERLGEAQPGETLSLETSEGSGLRTITVGRNYLSASGRECKRLTDLNQQSLQQVVCRIDQGRWVIQPPLTLLKEAMEPQLISNVGIPSPSKNEVVGGTEVIEVDANFINSTEGSNPSEDLNAVLQTGQDGVATEEQFETAKRHINLDGDTSNVTPQKSIYDNKTLKLKVGETLWSFSRRVTGHGENWREIAKVNGIQDARTLSGGQDLGVPKVLIIESMLKAAIEQPVPVEIQ